MPTQIQRALERASRERHAQGSGAPHASHRVAYDAAACIQNRVLIPENDAPRRTNWSAAYRVLRTRLLQRVRANSWTTVGVTSPGQGDGKSLTALNLALSLAREGNNEIFLIDFDMRNPRMCKYLGATPPGSINDFLSGRIQAQDVLFSLGIPNLTVAGTRTPTEQASELLASSRVEALFAHIRNEANSPLILLDLPPLLSTDDALVVAPKVDCSLMVVAEGRSRREGVTKALELVADFNLAGVVLNRSNMMVTDYYGY